LTFSQRKVGSFMPGAKDGRGKLFHRPCPFFPCPRP
jgi:hypothetical protein